MDQGMEGVAGCCDFGRLGLLVSGETRVNWRVSLWTYLVGVAYDYEISRECFSVELGPGVASLHGEGTVAPFCVWAWGVGGVEFVVFNAVADAGG